MAQQKYPRVPAAKISSIDINSFDAGLDQRGQANIKPNSFSVGRNAMVTAQGLITHRLGLKRWLPDLVGTVYQVFPALFNGVVYYVTADNGKIKYCVEGATSWTLAGGDNTITTIIGKPNTFLRVLDKVLILNGTDTLGYLSLSGMTVVHFNFVADPTVAPTGVVVGSITGTTQKVYYNISYNSVVGKTISSPILTQQLGKIREQWATDRSQGVTVTDPNIRPTGAVSWNVYLSTSPAGGTIQRSDMLPIALGLDIGITTFFDNGSITQLTNAGTSPETNSTQGAKAKYGKEIDGRPFLYGITGDPYAVIIGGNDLFALDFTETNGGYRLVLNSGTNFYPMSVVGFRNGQGIPSTTVLFSNTEGLSKQTIIAQSTVSLGTFSSIVWGSTEQNYGAAGVSSPYAVSDYRGALIFPTTDGILKLDTEASLQNVLSPQRISDPIVGEVGSIKTNLLGQIISTAWENRILLSAPTGGFDYNNKILIYDVTRKNAEMWYTFDIASQWLGTISPPNSSGFVYISQANHLFRLDTMYVAQDETPTGLTQPFPMQVTSGLIGTNSAHDGFYAVVQVVFYLVDFVGSVDLIVTWRDYQSGKMKSKIKTVTNGTYAKSSVGGWSSSGYLFNQNITTKVLRWGETDVLTDGQSAQKQDQRFRITLNNVVTNELQATIAINLDNSAVVGRSVSFQGQPLGISPDVR